MSGVLDSVDSRTRLAGHNRLELLLFRLEGDQRYGINVFKVQEVIRCPKLTHMPKSDRRIVGVAHLRNRTIPVIDLGLVINNQPISDIENSFVIVSEYNRKVQGFMVRSVDRIANMNWEEILPPPSDSYLTAVTQLGDEIVEIIDVERIFAEIMGQSEAVSKDILQSASKVEEESLRHVLVVDDSPVARNQIRRVLEKVGVECTLVNDGKAALEQLQEWVDEDVPISKKIDLVISDIEMPRMDGYKLTTEIRKDPRLQSLFIILHTSLSGVFNNSMVEKVGADHFIAKFKPNELAHSVLNIIQNKSPTEGLDQVSDD